MADSAAIRIVADLKPYLDEVKKLGPMTDQEALKAAMALESRATKAAEKAAKAAKDAAAEAARAARTSGKAAGDAFDSFGDGAEKNLSKAAKFAALTGDAFGGLAGPIGDVGDAFGMMSASSAAALVGVGALVAGFGAMVSISLDVIRNAEDYKGVMGENEDAILDAAEAVEALDRAMARQKAFMAGEMAPAISQLSYAYIGMTDRIGANIERLMDSRLAQWLSDNSIVIKMLGDFAKEGEEIAKRQADAEQRAKDTEAAMKASEERRAAEAKAAEEAAKRREEEAAKRREEAAKRAEQRRKAEREQLEKDARLNEERAEEMYEKIQRLKEQSSFVEAFTAGLPDAFAEVEASIDTVGALYEKNRQYQFEEEIRMAKAALAEKAALEAEAAAQKADQDRQAQQEFEKQQIEGIAGISGYIGQTLGLISGMYDENTKEGRKAIREMAIAQKAAAIFDVAIKGVQAVMAALTIPPPAGPILAVAAGVTAAASAASVAAQPLPSFHSGRFAGAIQPVQPDESPAMLRRGEVVVPAPTVRANGGVDGVRQRLGERGGDGGMVLAIDLTDRRIRLPLARDMARAIPASPYLGWAF
jgi:hypothetical protein